MLNLYLKTFLLRQNRDIRVIILKNLIIIFMALNEIFQNNFKVLGGLYEIGNNLKKIFKNEEF